jgi:hypothetical protein
MPDELPVFRIMWRDCGPMGSGEGYYAVRHDAKLVLGPYPNQIDAGKAAREWVIARAATGDATWPPPCAAS